MEVLRHKKQVSWSEKHGCQDPSNTPLFFSHRRVAQRLHATYSLLPPPPAPSSGTRQQEDGQVGLDDDEGCGEDE